MTRLFLAFVLLSALPACFDEPRPACAFLCGPSGGCPTGYMCSTDDDRCHRVDEGGALAVCEDELPGDAGNGDGGPDGSVSDGGIDASSADAASPDATPADAGPPNNAPVLGAITSQTSRAGTTILRTFTATDADTGQTLSFTAEWPGTNRDPFASRPGDLTDTIGATFNPVTHAFTLDSTCLGVYDLLVTVSDGAGGSDSQMVAFTYTAFPVLINEVQLGAVNTLQNIELLNTSGTMLDVSGMRVCAGSSCFALPAGTTIAAGGFLVVHDDVGTDDATNVFAAGALGAVDTAREVVLLDATDDLSLSCKYLDYVAWDAAGSRGAQGVFAGQWAAAGDAVDITGIVIGSETIARTAGANSESAADFVVDTTPTLGAANN